MDNIKIFIFESLVDDDELTGSALYKDLESQRNPGSNLFLYNNIIDNKDFFGALNQAKEIVSLGDVVFFHFEMHGLSDGNGLSLKNGDICYYNDICKVCLEINKKLGCNLYLTLAVCHGLWMLSGIVMDMSFCGIIGSQEKIYESDLRIRYKEFYESLFIGNGDIDYAMDELHRANTKRIDTYKYIKLETIFIDAYRTTVKRFNSSGWRKLNAVMISKENNLNRSKRRAFEKKSKKHSDITRSLYHEVVKRVFMLDEFPDNKNRFNIPKYKEFEE